MRRPSRLARLAWLAIAGLLLAAGAPIASRAEDERAPAAAPPETIRWESTAGEVVFAHLMHSEDFGADCVACHHETSAVGLELPHPDYFDDFWIDCATCHGGSKERAALDRCATCHPERPTGPHVEMPTVKVAIHRSCWSCHEQGTGAEATGQCSFCHQQQETTAAPAAAPVTQ
ncbi:MAG: cytochrome c3 family protein [Thermoanaerobaculia bacterium]|jgi:hypothetical protein|nr:MAG: cytochrome c3 family protein [Thermoanaerobaculia bacterium]MBZ0102770.1 cytochrome c family protein [Thermoanaerobaculia bacterium]